MRNRRAELCTTNIPKYWQQLPYQAAEQIWSTKSSEVSEGGLKMKLQIMGEEDKSRYCYFLGLWLVSPLFKVFFILRSLKFTLSTECLRVWAVRTEHQKF